MFAVKRKKWVFYGSWVCCRCSCCVATALGHVWVWIVNCQMLPPLQGNGGELVLLWREATEIEYKWVLLAGEMAVGNGRGLGV